jgi:hypothetical protein
MVSTLNSNDGRVKANATIVSGGSGGDVSVFANNKADVVNPGWVSECSLTNIPAIETCGNITAMPEMAHNAGIKTIVGTIPVDAQGDGDLFNRGLRQDVTLPGAIGHLCGA